MPTSRAHMYMHVLNPAWCALCKTVFPMASTTACGRLKQHVGTKQHLAAFVQAARSHLGVGIVEPGQVGAPDLRSAAVVPCTGYDSRFDTPAEPYKGVYYAKIACRCITTWVLFRGRLHGSCFIDVAVHAKGTPSIEFI